MFSIRHCGIYVDDIQKMTLFYKEVFHMHVICCEEADEGDYVDTLTCSQNAKIVITKLITDRGKESGSGDMLELIKIMGSAAPPGEMSIHKFTQTGNIHIAMECDDIKKTVVNLELAGGTTLIAPFKRENNNWLCFCLDPEGNCLELIERNREECK